MPACSSHTRSLCRPRSSCCVLHISHATSVVHGGQPDEVTRSFRANGKFTARQKAIYDLVRATQQAAFDSTRPGATMAQLDRVARDYMRADSGTLCFFLTYAASPNLSLLPLHGPLPN